MRIVLRLLKWVLVAIPVLAIAAYGIAYVRSTNDCSGDLPPAPRVGVRAALQCEYGGPEQVSLTKVEKPVPGDGEVLVRVRASSVNPADWHFMRGTPYVARLVMGVRVPSETRPGTDYAGTVEAVGGGVTQFVVGDDVFGTARGAYGDYVVVRADRNIVKKPANVSFEQAGAVPVAAITALQALRDVGRVARGESVLINGASGGVGTYAVQIAKAMGARVTGVNSGRNVAMVRSIGADSVIDYTKDDFTRGSARYDVIVDNVGNHPLGTVRHLLKPGGRFVIVGGEKGNWLDPLPRVAWATVLSKVTGQELRFFVAQTNQRDLQELANLMAAGKMTSVIDRKYPLDSLQAAIRYQEGGRAKGKVVVVMASDSAPELRP